MNDRSSDPEQPIRVATGKIDARELIQQQANEIDKLTNNVAMFKELVQQLRDEIAILKGQNPKPNMSPSIGLDDQKQPHWRKRITKIQIARDTEGRTVLFALWVKTSMSHKVTCIFKTHRFLPVAPIAALPLLQARILDIKM